MNKYKVGDKIVLTVSDVNEKAYYSYYVFNNNDLILWEPSTDKYAEPLTTYTEPLEAKIRRQAAEITRLLKDNAELKKGREAIRDNAFEAGLIRGQEEAWELMIKMGNMYCYDLEKIFGLSEPWDIITNLSYQKTAAKVAEWERKKEEICVGDVLLSKTIPTKCIVISFEKLENTVYILWKDGSSGKRNVNELKKDFKKIGHIDVASMLSQIGEDNA